MRCQGNVCGVGRVRAGLGVAMALATSIALGGCTTNPATGKNIFTLGMSTEQQAALGAEAAPQFTQEYGGAVPDAECQAYVRDLGARLAAQVESRYQGLPWEFTFLNSDAVNAFALPGGKVFFTRGLASRLTNEAQMAGVMGHEVGHVTAEHGAQRIAKATAFNLGTTVVAVVVQSSGNERVRQAGAIGVPALQVGGNLVMLKYGRDEELEADQLGVRYMSKLGYDPKGQMQVMEVLQSLSAGGRQPDILSTHPDPAKRIEQIRGLLGGEYASTQNNPQFQLREQEYRTRMLSRLARLAPAPKPSATGMVDGLGPSVLWCAHCREDVDRLHSD